MSKPLPKNQRYVLNKEYRRLGYGLNKALNEFKDAGVSSNKTRLLEETLEQFYQSNNLKVSNPKRVTLQKYMTEEQATELSGIVLSFAEDANGLVLSEYESKISDMQQVIQDAKNIGGEENFNIERFKKHEEMFGKASYQEYIDRIDALNKRKENALLNDLTTSDQIAELAAVAHTRGYTNEELENMIEQIYNDTGKMGNDLYEDVLNVISPY